MNSSIEKNTSLLPYNTFGIDVNAAYFSKVENTSELLAAFAFAKQNNLPTLILGGGSNMLFGKDYEGLVVKNNFGGRAIIQNSDNEVLVKVGAGENWHEFVKWTLAQGLCGLQNLSLIPGTVGASPVQNIGAYGVEIKDLLVSLEAIDPYSGAKKTFLNEACKFGYRDSIFKNEEKDKWFISSLTFKLYRKPQKLDIGYGDIQKVLLEKGFALEAFEHPTPEMAATLAIALGLAVEEIRQSKLPNPAELGNAGSFFKNPIVPKALCDSLLLAHPDMPHYPQADGSVKIPAGWLIEQSGLKGKRFGNTGSHAKQALVIVNYGGASGQEIWEHALRVIDTVAQRFGVTLQPEVRMIGT